MKSYTQTYLFLLYTNLVADSDLMERKQSADHDVATYNNRLSAGARRPDSVWIYETGSGGRHDDDVTATAGACAQHEEQIHCRRHIRFIEIWRPVRNRSGADYRYRSTNCE